MINDKIEVTLNEKKYQARMDFKAIAETQWTLDTERGKFLTVPNIIKGLVDGNLVIIGELLIQCILRCHPQLNHEILYENMKYAELRNINDAVGELIKASLPQDKDDKKKEKEN